MTQNDLNNILKLMPTNRLSLQNRITSLMIISSIMLISAFTFIQVNNQLSNINRFNLYQANLSSTIIKNNLETTLSQTTQEGYNIKDYLKLNLNQFIESNIISQAIVFNQSGEILASTRNIQEKETINFRDLANLEKFKELPADSWILSEVDKKENKLVIYIKIFPNPEATGIYIAKTTFPLADIQNALTEVYRPVGLAIIIVIMANILIGILISKAVIGPIKVLNQVTKIIAAGDLSVRTRINTQDELQELGNTFNFMTEELIKMKERAENANPLTKLPGNIIIHEQIENRIKNNRKFVVIYCDLDNFKAFNDKYGIAKGDLAIKLTADIFKESTKAQGNLDDFVGHEGGDDFILITTPNKASLVANYITQEFDKRVRSLYNQEDLSTGYIIAHARDGSVKQFPIMTISLAGVTNETKNISSYAEVTNIAAEVKKKAKSIDGSTFVMDQRKSGIR